MFVCFVKLNDETNFTELMNFDKYFVSLIHVHCLKSQCWQARPWTFIFLHNFHLDSSEVV